MGGGPVKCPILLREKSRSTLAVVRSARKIGHLTGPPTGHTGRGRGGCRACGARVGVLADCNGESCIAVRLFGRNAAPNPAPPRRVAAALTMHSSGPGHSLSAPGPSAKCSSGAECIAKAAGPGSRCALTKPGRGLPAMRLVAAGPDVLRGRPSAWGGAGGTPTAAAVPSVASPPKRRFLGGVWSGVSAGLPHSTLPVVRAGGGLFATAGVVLCGPSGVISTPGICRGS